MPLHRVFAGVRLSLDGPVLVEEGGRGRRSEHESELAALVALHQRAVVLVREGVLEDVERATGELEVDGARFPMPLSRSALEARLGAHLHERGATVLPMAVPLLFLEWPVGYRFASLFEARPRDRAARAAVAHAIASLDARTATGAGELFRVAGVQRNLAALAPALALLPSVRSFDAWMDVLELAYDVGDRSHVQALRALAKSRAPADAREAAAELALELRGRSPR